MKPDPSRASALAKEGLELWDAGRLSDAAAKYVAAVECADPNDYALPDYHAGLAGILSALERDAEACDQYRAALAVSLRHEPDEAGAAVIVARYFLAEHLLKMKEPNQALAVIGPSVGLATKQEWLVRVVEARALWVLGRTGESRRAAELAVTRAPSETKANELRHHLAEILNSPKAG